MLTLYINITLSWLAARRRKKSKLKKILIPIAVFLLLKALTLIPLFIGILGIKAWNALQLSFGSFVLSFALAIFQLCKKLAGDSAPPQPIVAHASGWESQRSLEPGFDAQNLVYRAYTQAAWEKNGLYYAEGQTDTFPDLHRSRRLPRILHEWQNSWCDYEWQIHASCRSDELPVVSRSDRP